MLFHAFISREKKTSKYNTKKVQTNIITNKVNDKRRGNANNESDLCVKNLKGIKLWLTHVIKAFKISQTKKQ